MTAGGLATVVALTGCTSGQDDSASPPHTSAAGPTASSTGTPTSDRAENVPGETVTKAPFLPQGEVVAQAADASGSQELEIRGGIKAGTLSVLVNCRGKGELTVSVKPVGLSFPLECVDGQTSSIFNQLDQKRTHAQGTVSVTAPSRVRWSLTVGQ